MLLANVTLFDTPEAGDNTAPAEPEPKRPDHQEALTSCVFTFPVVASAPVIIVPDAAPTLSGVTTADKTDSQQSIDVPVAQNNDAGAAVTGAHSPVPRWMEATPTRARTIHARDLADQSAILDSAIPDTPASAGSTLATGMPPQLMRAIVRDQPPHEAIPSAAGVRVDNNSAQPGPTLVVQAGSWGERSIAVGLKVRTAESATERAPVAVAATPARLGAPAQITVPRASVPSVRTENASPAARPASNTNQHRDSATPADSVQDVEGTSHSSVDTRRHAAAQKADTEDDPRNNPSPETQLADSAARGPATRFQAVEEPPANRITTKETHEAATKAVVTETPAPGADRADTTSRTVRNLSLKMGDSDRRVDVELTQRDGAIQVRLRSDAPAIARKLNEDLPQLVSALHDASLHVSSSAKESSPDAGSSRGGQGQDSADSQEQRHRPRHPAEQTDVDEDFGRALRSAAERN